MGFNKHNDARRQQKNEPGFTMFEKVAIAQMIVCRGDLYPMEFTVAMHVWWGSIGFGREGAYMGTQQIADAAKMSRSTVTEVLSRLELQGKITKKRGRDRNYLAINPEWINEMKLGTKHDLAKMKEKEGLGDDWENTVTDHVAVSQAAQMPDSDVRQTSSEVSGTHTPTNKNQLELKSRGMGAQFIAPIVVDSPLKDLEWIDKPVTGGRLARTWMRAWSRSPFVITGTFSDMSPKAKKQLSELRRDWQWENRELHFFVTWVIADFQHIKNQFSWMKNPPSQPGPGWVLVMREQLMSMWAEFVRAEFLDDMSISRLDRLMVSGMIYASEVKARENTVEAHPQKIHEPVDEMEVEDAWRSLPPAKWRNR